MSGISNQIGHVAPQTAPLGKQFGDAPLGRVGGHQLSATNPGNPRVMQPTTGDKVKAFFERALNAMTPKSVRVDAKIQEATKALSRHVGDALGGLAAKPASPETTAATKNALIKLTADSVELTKRGVPFDQALGSRIGVHLSQLGADELAAIVQATRGKGGEALLNELVAEGHQEAVAAFGKIANDAVRYAEDLLTAKTEGQVDNILQKSLEKVDTPAVFGGKNAFVDEFSKAEGPGANLANELVNKFGATMTPAERSGYGQGAVKDGLARMQPQDLAKLLTRVPTEDLASLAKATSKTGKDLSAVDTAIQNEVAARTNRLSNDLDHAMHDTHEATSFGKAADNIIKGGEVVAALAKHAAQHGTPTASQLGTDSLAILKLDIADAFGKADIRDDLAQLEPQQLVRLSKALASLGMDNAKALVDTEISQRKSVADGEFQHAANAFGAAIMQGNTSDVVGALKHLNNEIESLALKHQELGAKVADLGDRKDFLANAMQKAIDSLPDMTRQAIKGYVSLPETQQMIFGFMEMGAQMQVTSPQVGRMLSNVGEKLDMIATAVGAPLPPLDENMTLAERLNTDARVALKSNFDVIMDGDTMPFAKGTTPVDAQFTERTKTAFDERKESKPSTLNPAVDASFGIDVSRATFAVMGKTLAKDLDQALVVLQEFASSPEELMAITGVMNQTSSIALANGLFRNLSGESAFAFEDGTQFKPQSGGDGRTLLSYDLHRNQDGEPVVTVNIEYVDLKAVQGVPSGDRIPVNGGSVGASMTVTLHADGTSDIAAVKTKVSISEFGRMLRDPALISTRDAFEADVTTRQLSGENIRFWKEVEVFRENPSAQKAADLMAKYVGDSAPEQINIDGLLVQQLQLVLAKVQSGTASEQELQSMFDPPQAVIENVMTMDSYPKFLKQQGTT
jgi:Regulator of G protein signaling domain